jgi:hypothetical protein
MDNMELLKAIKEMMDTSLKEIEDDIKVKKKGKAIPVPGHGGP